MTQRIDLRSDTVTRPTRRMRRAMADAEVGDDVYGEDPTVRWLEEDAAERLGKERAVFFPSGTMANQAAIHVQTRPGDEVVLEATGHSMDWELGGMAVISGVQPRPLAGDAGVLTPERLSAALEPRPSFRSPVGLVILENTHNMAGGRVYPPELFREAVDRCHRAGVPVHLDGARLWNAAVASGETPAALARGCASVMVSLSKGLCAPVGSLLAGDADLMSEARRVRKLLGGGMRQVGVVAAAGLVALDEMVERLAEDHRTARRLADGLTDTGRIDLAFGHVDTNIVVVDVERTGRTAAAFCEALGARDVLCLPTGATTVRFVTHNDVATEAVDEALRRVRATLEPG